MLRCCILVLLVLPCLVSSLDISIGYNDMIETTEGYYCFSSEPNHGAYPIDELNRACQIYNTSIDNNYLMI